MINKLLISVLILSAISLASASDIYAPPPVVIVQEPYKPLSIDEMVKQAKLMAIAKALKENPNADVSKIIDFDPFSNSQREKSEKSLKEEQARKEEEERRNHEILLSVAKNMHGYDKDPNSTLIKLMDAMTATNSNPLNASHFLSLGEKYIQHVTPKFYFGKIKPEDNYTNAMQAMIGLGLQISAETLNVKPEFILQSINKPWFTPIQNDKGELLITSIIVLAFQTYSVKNDYVSSGCKTPGFLNQNVIDAYVKKYNPDIITGIKSALTTPSPVFIKEAELANSWNWREWCNGANKAGKEGVDGWTELLKVAGVWSNNLIKTP